MLMSQPKIEDCKFEYSFYLDEDSLYVFATGINGIFVGNKGFGDKVYDILDNFGKELIDHIFVSRSITYKIVRYQFISYVSECHDELMVACNKI